MTGNFPRSVANFTRWREKRCATWSVKCDELWWTGLGRGWNLLMEGMALWQAEVLQIYTWLISFCHHHRISWDAGLAEREDLDLEVSWNGVTLKSFILYNRIFHYKPSSYFRIPISGTAHFLFSPRVSHLKVYVVDPFWLKSSLEGALMHGPDAWNRWKSMGVWGTLCSNKPIGRFSRHASVMVWETYPITASMSDITRRYDLQTFW